MSDLSRPPSRRGKRKSYSSCKIKPGQTLIGPLEMTPATSGLLGLPDVEGSSRLDNNPLASHYDRTRKRDLSYKIPSLKPSNAPTTKRESPLAEARRLQGMPFGGGGGRRPNHHHHNTHPSGPFLKDTTVSSSDRVKGITSQPSYRPLPGSPTATTTTCSTTGRRIHNQEPLDSLAKLSGHSSAGIQPKQHGKTDFLENALKRQVVDLVDDDGGGSEVDVHHTDGHETKQSGTAHPTMVAARKIGNPQQQSLSTNDLSSVWSSNDEGEDVQPGYVAALQQRIPRKTTGATTTTTTSRDMAQSFLSHGLDHEPSTREDEGYSTNPSRRTRRKRSPTTKAPIPSFATRPPPMGASPQAAIDVPDDDSEDKPTTGQQSRPRNKRKRSSLLDDTSNEDGLDKPKRSVFQHFTETVETFRQGASNAVNRVVRNLTPLSMKKIKVTQGESVQFRPTPPENLPDDLKPIASSNRSRSQQVVGKHRKHPSDSAFESSSDEEIWHPKDGVTRVTDGSDGLKRAMEAIGETRSSTSILYGGGAGIMNTNNQRRERKTFSISKSNNKNPMASNGSETRTTMMNKRKKGQLVVAGATIGKANASQSSSQKSSSRHFQWRDGDDSDYSEEQAADPVQRRSLRTGRRTPKNIMKSPEVVDMCNSDSEIEEVGAPEESTIVLDLTRMAIGTRVWYAECQASLDPVTMELELRYKRTQRTTRTRTDDHNQFVTLPLSLRDGSVSKIMLYEGSDQRNVALVGGDDDDDDDADQLGPLVALHIHVTPENKLDQYRRDFDPKKGNAGKKYLVLELRYKSDFKRMIAILSRLAADIQQIEVSPTKVRKYAASLLASNPKNRGRAIKRNAFLDGRPSDYALLVYPFAGDPTEIEKAADGLTEAAGTLTTGAATISPAPSDDKEDGEGKSRHRAHFVTITVEDYDRLEPGEWLNDSLVDLWMQWISRDNTTLDSRFHFFTSHFYSRLAAEGPDSVAGWTRRKNINIFNKKLIFVPINKAMHWSLCVVVNPGALVDAAGRTPTKDDPLSCMIFMDSLRMHNKATVANHVRKWLNSEYNRMAGENVTTGRRMEEETYFGSDNFPIFSPRVPLQNNSWDCGVFVCRYAYAIYELRDRDFTYGDAGMHCETTDLKTGSSSRAFQELISDGAEFDFNMDDIARFREEFKTLIENLSRLYVTAKSAEKQAILEEKMKRQAATTKGRYASENDENSTTFQTNGSEPIESSEDDSPLEVAPSRITSSPAMVVSNEKENRNNTEFEKDAPDVDEFYSSQSIDEILKVAQRSPGQSSHSSNVNNSADAMSV